jgi:hypothetical protein
MAIPAVAAVELVDRLRTASLDAEELYWEAVVPVVRRTGSSDPQTVVAAIERWLTRQDWADVVRRVPAGADEMFVVSHAGHVGLVIPPPFTDRRTVAVFDPLQLRRLAPSLQGALAQAADGPMAPVIPDRVATVVGILREMPWQPPPGFVEPTLERAEAELLSRRRAFLGREPFARPQENNLPFDGE